MKNENKLWEKAHLQKTINMKIIRKWKGQLLLLKIGQDKSGYNSDWIVTGNVLLHNFLSKSIYVSPLYCIELLSKALEVSKVFKSKALAFAQFWLKFENSTSGWSKTQKIQEKIFPSNICENVVLVGKKPVEGISEN